jgi:hypothetical protein
MVFSTRKICAPLILALVAVAGCSHQGDDNSTPPSASTAAAPAASPMPATPSTAGAPAMNSTAAAPAYPQSSPAPATSTH